MADRRSDLARSRVAAWGLSSRATLALLVLLAPPARAGSPLDEPHAAGYYAARAGAVVGATGLTLATTVLMRPEPPSPAASEWLGWDDAVRGRLSTSASTASDLTLVTAVITPIGAELTYGVDTRLANMSIIYAEVLSANGLLNTIVKYSAPRLRPYNYRVPPASDYVGSQGVDAYLSFYSGHASTAFASALGGSYLFSAAHDGSAVNAWLWGAEMGLATATSIWRVRAGKHFYSDVAIGILVGSAIGLGIPLAEGVRYRPSATEMAFAAGGVAIGGLVAVLAPFDDGDATALGTQSRHLQVLPLFARDSAGLSMRGDF